MEKRKTKKWARPIHRVTYAVLRFILTPYYKIRLNYTAERTNVPKNYPCVILSNHQTFDDQFLVGLSFPYTVYMVASERLFNLGFASKIIQTLAAPVKKTKSRADISAVKNCLKILKEGGKILIFPEGNCTYTGEPCNISIAAAKMVKMLKAPLVIYNLNGGYGGRPRWAKSYRKGKVTGRVVKIIQPEEYANMSAEELHKLIVEALNVKEVPSSAAFKSRRRAEYLEKVLYFCPECGRYECLYSKGNYVYCERCGAKWEYGVNLTLKGNFPFSDSGATVNEWYLLQAGKLFEKIKNESDKDKIIFGGDEGTLSYFENGKTKKLCRGKISVSQNALTAGGKTFAYGSIEAVTVQQNSALIFYADGVSYFFKGGKLFNPVKYMHAFYITKHLQGGPDDTADIGDVYLGL